ncbi:MAG: xanthine dehydrogenase accessory protein XdhC [Cytophagales bacterium]|nr:xanthine dehydrogenase accessory protein XdhC [Cytophagales bacterium]
MILITVTQTQGSVPRETGTWMVVADDKIMGTLGGGHVEFQAIAYAKNLKNESEKTKRFALGPSLGQCCGGVMDLAFEHIDSAQLAQLEAKQDVACKPVALFGGGHVGRAIIHILATLPYRTTWIDSRDEIFPKDVPSHVICEHSDPVQSAVSQLASGSAVLIMSFSHAEDLEIVQQCLKRNRACLARGANHDLPFIGLIGSTTKWATFQNRLRERGFAEAELAQVTCPIGLEGISGKEPAVIAVAVAAQLLRLNHSTNSDC